MSTNLEFTFSDAERDKLYTQLVRIKSNPYTQLSDFRNEVGAIKDVPAVMLDFAQAFRSASPEDTPFCFGHNCPIDLNLPELNWETPVEDKYNKKKTYVAEALLTLFEQLLKTPAIGHRSVNNGDIFHDIAPKKSLHKTQSQKALGTLKFHKDFTNHFAVPDYVLQIVLRNDDANIVNSTYVSNKQVIEHLAAEDQALLSSDNFYTPYDDITKLSGYQVQAITENHPILGSDFAVKFFEGRTETVLDNCAKAMNALIKILHEKKVIRRPRPGEFTIMRNNYCLHGKEVEFISDLEALKQRWIIKTHNVDDISLYDRFFEPTNYGVIQG